MLPARKQVNGSFSRHQHPDLASSESWPPSVATPPPLTTADRVAVHLRVDAPWHPWLETPVIDAVDACAPPAP